ncbi:MAG TPA: hypothetical protein VHO70_25090 [Chitinispirillaceae bacterium]|nr:hypothetical protein [Chitinispirillaceae bacterium]
MNFEHELENSLRTVPELPPDLFGRIEKKVVFNQKRNVLYYSVAASLLLFLGSLLFTLHKPVYTVEQEVADELQTLHDYVNGEDLDKDLEMYAIINNY